MSWTDDPTYIGARPEGVSQCPSVFWLGGSPPSGLVLSASPSVWPTSVFAVSVSFTVRNTGERTGAEVAQVYAARCPPLVHATLGQESRPDADLPRPVGAGKEHYAGTVGPSDARPLPSRSI